MQLGGCKMKILAPSSRGSGGEPQLRDEVRQVYRDNELPQANFGEHPGYNGSDDWGDVAAAVAARRHQSLTLAAWMCSRVGAASRPAVRPRDVDPADAQVRPLAVDPAAWTCWRGGVASRPAVRPLAVNLADAQVRPLGVDHLRG